MKLKALNIEDTVFRIEHYEVVQDTIQAIIFYKDNVVRFILASDNSIVYNLNDLYLNYDDAYKALQDEDFALHHFDNIDLCFVNEEETKQDTVCNTMTNPDNKPVCPITLDEDENLLYCSHPARQYYLFELIASFVLIPFLIGIPLLFYMIYQREKTWNIITTKRVATMTNLFATNYDEVSIRDIRGVFMRKTFIQQQLGIGNILIGSAATLGLEITLLGIENPEKVIHNINLLRKSSN